MIIEDIRRFGLAGQRAQEAVDLAVAEAETKTRVPTVDGREALAWWNALAPQDQRGAFRKVKRLLGVEPTPALVWQLWKQGTLRVKTEGQRPKAEGRAAA